MITLSRVTEALMIRAYVALHFKDRDLPVTLNKSKVILKYCKSEFIKIWEICEKVIGSLVVVVEGLIINKLVRGGGHGGRCGKS